jgi:hypothetical protein
VRSKRGISIDADSGPLRYTRDRNVCPWLPFYEVKCHVPEGRNESERIATLTSFSIFDFLDMKSLQLKFGRDIFSGFKMASP